LDGVVEEAMSDVGSKETNGIKKSETKEFVTTNCSSSYR
jgi:hypothetical protein